MFHYHRTPMLYHIGMGTKKEYTPPRLTAYAQEYSRLAEPNATVFAQGAHVPPTYTNVVDQDESRFTLTKLWRACLATRCRNCLALHTHHLTVATPLPFQPRTLCFPSLVHAWAVDVRRCGQGQPAQDRRIRRGCPGHQWPGRKPGISSFWAAGRCADVSRLSSTPPSASRSLYVRCPGCPRPQATFRCLTRFGGHIDPKVSETLTAGSRPAGSIPTPRNRRRPRRPAPPSANDGRHSARPSRHGLAATPAASPAPPNNPGPPPERIRTIPVLRMPPP